MENHLLHRRMESEWRLLKRYHATDEVLLANPDYIDALDLTRPIVKVKIEDWAAYVNALAAVLSIGRRNKWVEFKQNQQGQTVLWCLLKTAVTG